MSRAWSSAGPQARKSLRLCLAGLRIRCFDPIAKASELADHSRSAPLLRLFGNGWAPFFVVDSLVQDQPNQPTLSIRRSLVRRLERLGHKVTLEPLALTA
jgi:hypothetical protein